MPDRSVRRPRPDHADQKRMTAAEAVSQWYLGHRSWAQMLIGAYMYPDEAMENLRRERDEDPVKVEPPDSAAFDLLLRRFEEG